MVYFHILDPEGDSKVRQTYCGLISTYDSYAFTDKWLGPSEKGACEACIYLLNKEHNVPDQNTRANAVDQINELGLIHSDALIKAVEKRIPQPHLRSRMLATVASEERRRDAEQESARNLSYWFDDYKGRKIEIPCRGKGGVLKNAKLAGGGKEIALLFGDDQLEVVTADTPIYVFPRMHESCLGAGVETEEVGYEQRCQKTFQRKFKESLQCRKSVGHRGLCVFMREDGVICYLEDNWHLVPVSETLRDREERAQVTEIKVSNPESEAVDFMHSTMETLMDNLEQYRGYTIEVCGITGVLRDMQADPSGTNWYMVVINDRIGHIGPATPVVVHVPKPKPPRCFFKTSVEGLWMVRHQHWGKTIRYDGSNEDIGTMTAMAEGRGRGGSYIVVVDGNIIHFTPDATIWVEL